MAQNEALNSPYADSSKILSKLGQVCPTNVCLPMNYIRKMFGDDGYINQRLSGRDSSAYHKKTTIGEGIQFFSYMLCIADNPGPPVRAMYVDGEHGEACRTRCLPKSA